MKDKYKMKSFLRSSKNRRMILNLLVELDEPIIPSEIASKLDLQRASVSRTLSELSKKNLVECLNPESKKYKYYRITEKGKKSFSLID